MKKLNNKKRIIPLILAGAVAVSASAAAFAESIAASVMTITKFSGYIDIKAAIDAAVDATGLYSDDVYVTKAELDTVDGTPVYEIELVTQNGKAEYDINAVDATVVKASNEALSSSQTSADADSQGIGVEAAKAAAYAHAGVKEADVVLKKAKLDRKDGQYVYDIEFYAGSSEYEYEISAADGTIVEYKVEAIKTSGAAGTTVSISVEEAKAAAYSHASVNEADVTLTKAKLDFDNGGYVYDIEFYTAGKEYEYEISAADGSVVEYQVETISSSGSSSSAGSSGTSASAKITLAEAKAIAYEYAGVDEAYVTPTHARPARDDGQYVYDIEFYVENKEYEFEISAVSGKVLEYDVETKSTSISANTSANSNTSGTISVEEAKAAAYAHAGVNEADVTLKKAKLERDDGQYVYDIEFYVSSIEYEYEISAEDASIIQYKVEGEKNTSSANVSITLEEAKEIAFAHAGVSEANITLKKAKLDTDDGQYVYDIEFYYSNLEYEYEISAASGKIIEYDVEKRD